MQTVIDVKPDLQVRLNNGIINEVIWESTYILMNVLMTQHILLQRVKSHFPV